MVCKNYESPQKVNAVALSQKRRYKTMSQIWDIRESSEHHVAAGEREMTVPF